MMIATIALCRHEVSGQQARVMFYNAENFFDTRDDSLINDNEFLPDSARYWTYERFWRKAVRLYQVISAVDQWDMPAVVGLCEVENRDVLEKLVYDTPLKKYDYRIIHRDSPDPRGIDVALLYRSEFSLDPHRYGCRSIRTAIPRPGRYCWYLANCWISPLSSS